MQRIMRISHHRPSDRHWPSRFATVNLPLIPALPISTEPGVDLIWDISWDFPIARRLCCRRGER
ncbi:hypothetical protein [Bradyrhizobium sp. BR 10289]|uniref:hypothetical protein n=1 Tax=Bradyrhizobium sp. BR 10289 TaxID=2749993 RepID=UPI001C64E310|nr:hypothetical protein [Bradyrhizobium sp. BR 10289]MBW7970562.1 hypothetical protein [Bradyrhizobium sp. BR 10289]